MDKTIISLLAALFLFTTSTSGYTQQETAIPAQQAVPEQTVTSQGDVTIDNVKISYQTQAGIIDLRNNDPDDPTTSMFYVAYFKKNRSVDHTRPVTFIYNGGPGSSSLWLHIGAFGPERVIIPQPQKTALAPYQLTNNQYSLLDVSDLVFIDAPGTGYSHFTSQAATQDEREYQKSQSANKVYSVNGDAQAFSQFIGQFLTKYQRWNSPKYLLGESYGTTRSVVVADELHYRGINLNGIILISPIMNYDNNIDYPGLNPGIDQPYYLALPTYAASAWYHHRLPGKHPELQVFLNDAEQFALGPYAEALKQGSNLSEQDRQTIDDQLYQFTGISANYWLRNNLRLNGPAFASKLLSNQEEIISRSDTRYSGPVLADSAILGNYDPFGSAIGPAHVAQFQDYLSKSLGFKAKRNYLVFSDAGYDWNMSGNSPHRSFNVLPELSRVMRENPAMRVMLMSGIFDLATPYFTARYDMDHLPVPQKLRDNISFNWYNTGHLPYVDEQSLKKMHLDLSAFINNR